MRCFRAPGNLFQRRNEPRVAPFEQLHEGRDVRRMGMEVVALAVQRFDRLGRPADDELDEGLDVRLLDRIAILGDGDQADD